MKKLEKYTLYALLLALPSVAHAGAWTQKQGALQLIATANYYVAHDYYDVQGNKHPQVAFTKEEATLYGEYGLRDDITLGMQTSVARALQLNQSSWDMDDTELFLRKRVWQNSDSVASIAPSVVLPSPFHNNGIPIGSDHPSAGLRASYGTNFKAFGRGHYADISGAYYYRFSTPHDQLKLDATVGLNITDRWQLIPQAFITQSTQKIQNAAFTQSSGDDYDASKLQLTVQYNISPATALQLGAFDTIAGKNTGAGVGSILGFVGNF